MSSISTSLIKTRVKNNGKTLAQIQLEKILDRDIHENSLGCKISHTHIRIGKVHLDTFYEAQLLFGNAYWTDIFGFYVYQFVKKKIQENNYSKERPIILYGYETYSTLSLNKAISYLEKEDYEAHLRVFEVKDNRVRYCDDASIYSKANTDEKCYVDANILQKDPIVIFFVGISSTLSTFKYMNDMLILNNPNYKNVTKYCTSIIQVVGMATDVEDSNDPSKQFLEMGKDDFGEYVTSKYKEPYLAFIKSEEIPKAYYYVSSKSTWYTSEKCGLCMPKKFLNEKPLIEVDESSVVPTQMIRLNETSLKNNIVDPVEEFSMDTSTDFINDCSNSKYLRYDHIERNGNHHQYYFRLSRLYHDKKRDIEDWLKRIARTNSDDADNNSKIHCSFIGDRIINIIVAPQHFSNTGYVNSVNNIIFNGTAHIIEFDINKEYRSNFKAKYNNYCELEKIISELKDYTINFYYVNDQIVSGTTFYRAKSLVNSLFFHTNNKINVFQGIFVLFDRNSFETRKNYVKVIEGDFSYLPYFSYLKLEIPSLRNYNDSCPLCFNKNKAFDIINECALDDTVFYWQEKIVYHRCKSIEEVRRICVDEKMLHRHFIRLQCENDLWLATKKAYKKISDEIKEVPSDKKVALKNQIIVTLFYETIYDRIYKFSVNIQVEYIISYLKVMSRALLYYQEDVKKAVFDILLNLFYYFLKAIKYSNGIHLVFDEELPIGHRHLKIRLNNCSRDLQYNLFCMIISCLCSVGSCALLNYNRLIKCRIIGRCLLGAPSSKENDFDVFLLNNIKKLLCYDKGNSKAMLLQEVIWNEEIDNINTNKIKNNNEFFCELFLENTRHTSLQKNEDIIKQILSLQDVKDVIQKYKTLSEILIRDCLMRTNNSEKNTIEIQFFAIYNNKIVNITEGKIENPPISIGNFHQNGNTYYVGLGNNFSKLKEIQNSSYEHLDEILKTDLHLFKNAHIVIGIKSMSIKYVAQILKYRKEMLELVETDFNNDAIPKLMLMQVEARILSEIKTVSHTNKPLQEFENVFSLLPIGINSLNLQRKYLLLYMDTAISIAYREKLRFDYEFSSREDEPSMFELGWNKVNDKLEYVESQLESEYGDEIQLQIGKINNECFVPYSAEQQDKIKKSFKEEYEIIRFRKSVEIGEPYLIIKTFIDNAYKHCTNPKVWLKLVEENDGTYTLIVENPLKNRKKTFSNKRITLKALKYIFNNFLEIPEDIEDLDKNSNYTVKLKSFIKKRSKGDF